MFLIPVYLLSILHANLGTILPSYHQYYPYNYFIIKEYIYKQKGISG